MHGQIWLADLVRALTAMHATTDKHRALVAQMLGLGPTPATSTDPQLDPQLGGGATGDEPFVRTGAGVEEPSFGPEAAAISGDLPLLKPIRRDQVAPVGWGTEALPKTTASSKIVVTPHLTLLAPRTTAAILGVCIGRRILEGPLDIPAVVDALARHRVIEHLPREKVSTLRFGVQVLVDLGESMQPFGRDQYQLVAQIRTIVGAERTNVLYFADSPLRGAGPGPSVTWHPYQPPPSRTRVLVISHIGMFGPPLNPRRSRIAEWRALTRLLQRSGCDIVALVPLPRDRVLPTVAALLPIICWDRSTTVGHVAAVIGDR